MRFPLLNRIQGALLGAAFGDWLGGSDSAAAHDRPWNWPLATIAAAPATSRPAGIGAAIAIAITRELIQTGSWQPKPIAQLEPGLEIGLDAATRQPARLDSWAIATLPIALFFHEDDRRLHRALQQTLQTWQVPTQSIVCVRIVAQTIALILREQLQAGSIAPLMANLQTVLADTPEEPLIGLLERVQTLIEQHADLSTVHKTLFQTGLRSSDWLDDQRLAIALYGFLSTPDSLPLSLQRTAQVCPTACGLVGALSGAYNATAGIPAIWMLHSDRSRPGWGSPAQLNQLATQLTAAWSGVLDPVAANFAGSAAIAAPNVIRPR